MKPGRDFAEVLSAVLAEVPEERTGLRAEIERLKLAAPYVAPECAGHNWRALARALHENLNVPPKHPWEERIRIIMLGGKP